MIIPKGNRSSTGPALLHAASRLWLVCGGLVLTLSAILQAHPPWTLIAQRDDWRPDSSWRPRLSGVNGASQLVEGAKGHLFLSQGDSLFLSGDHGRTWKPASAPGTVSPPGRPVPLAVGPSGLVLWGDRISHDFCSTWQSPSDPTPRFASAFSIVGNRVWEGGLYDGISLSQDSGRTWKSVHRGNTFGRIEDLIYTWKGGGWHLAAPQSDQVLASRDGIAWTALASLAKPASDSGAAGKPGLIASILELENMPYDQVLWAVESTRSGKAALAEIRIGYQSGQPGLNSFDIIRHASLSAPDSAVTALGIYSPSGAIKTVLWLGTWGQGVFMSHDRGESWHAWNAGLGDLHVQSILVSNHGWNDSVFALTRDGLYRLGASPSGLDQTPRRSGSRTSPGGTPRSRFLLETPSGSRVRPDGRRASLPGSKP